MNTSSKAANLSRVAPASLFEAISKSTDISWLTTCLKHNTERRNAAVVEATQARLTALKPVTPKAVRAAAKPVAAVEHAVAIWDVLARRAGRPTAVAARITFIELIAAADLPKKMAARAMRVALDLVASHCAKLEMPPLNALVTDPDTKDADVSEQIGLVLKADWRAAPAPTAETLKAMMDERAGAVAA